MWTIRAEGPLLVAEECSSRHHLNRQMSSVLLHVVLFFFMAAVVRNLPIVVTYPKNRIQYMHLRRIAQA